jgi:anti-sigma regulatory factor (Ser/Thr protein kinase)
MSSLGEVLPTGLAAPRRARYLLRSWLDGLGWPAENADDLVLAVSEAVSNAVEHAYPAGRHGTVVLWADLLWGPNGTRRVLLTVTDHGAWHEPHPGDRRPRWGLRLIRAVTDRIDLRGSAAGTRLKAISRPE